MEKHEHGAGCCCDVGHSFVTEERPYVSPWQKAAKLKKARRTARETEYNPTLGRLRSPYPKDPVIGLRHLENIPLVLPEGVNPPTQRDIKEAQKAYNAARNRRRNVRK